MIARFRERGRGDKKKIKQSQTEAIAKWMFWSLTMLFSFVSYFAELRPIVVYLFGLYYSGVLDGIVVTIVTLCIVFHLASVVGKSH